MTMKHPRKRATARKQKSRKRSVQQTSGRLPPDPHLLESFWSKGGTRYFGYRLVLTGKLFNDALIQRITPGSRLTPRQVRVVVQLGLFASGSVRSLADGAFVDRAEVSRATRELLKRGLVRRIPNELDSRSSHFALSPKGRRAYAGIAKQARRLFVTTVQAIPRRRRDIVDQTLWQIARQCLTARGPDSVANRK